ncbi:MAG: adenylate/guanylate cyclase domain-containing protein [Lysobacteraceae bacterium]|nr:MAG: adenylate/guanylate cyclase domain-containing protein [Xanthomonadaceae bacterium]
MTEFKGHFLDLLLQYSQEPDPAQRQRLEDALWRTYGAERAVLVFDMSGFSELTYRYGIVHFLSMVRRMQLTTEPVILRYSGTLVKFEADNCYAMFPDVDAAIRAAREIKAVFDAANEATPDELDIHLACGIDYGRILVISGQDFFGNAVNRACKLGEDLAAAGEILITAEAMDTLAPDHGHAVTRVQFEISGLAIEAYRMKA